MDALDTAIVHINDVFWTWLLIPIVIAAGLYFTWRSRIVQLRLRGLGRRWMGALFAVVITLTVGFVFNAVQSNTIVATGERSLSADGEWFAAAVGLLLVALLGLVIFGGVRRIAKVTEVLVPVMAVAYIMIRYMCTTRI
ncbi:alanine:cation symporter family protein [Nocardia tengchongensis]|uniref:alanine:cation symporter family protein n=1 Tax=Nocardia tengchongensis TaxID=2055889 RepID=UPI0036A834C9